MARTAQHVTVTGRVQGVFFRAWTQAQARELGVTGWVRNAPDRSVEAHVEGDEAAVDALIQRMSDGSPAAKVADIHVADAVAERHGRFDVRH